MDKNGQIIVRAGDERYPVVFSDYRARLKPYVKGASKIVVVSNATVFALHGPSFIKKFLPAKSNVIPIMIGDGERYKTQRTVDLLYDQFFEIGLDRGDVIIAFGGGIVGDVAGFTAATYMRGVNLVQVPTTLLAMVDSSIGGKTGVNHRLGKNLIGAFYQPRAVVVNPDWLVTLGEREMIGGLAEIIKAGFLSSKKLLKAATATDTRYHPDDKDAVISLIRSAIRFKAGIVGRDVRDLGRRAILNFGHTFAHAIEKVEGYRNFQHGEAVMAGMGGALYLSHITGRLSEADLKLYIEYLTPFLVRLRKLKRDASDYLSPLAVDKKSKRGKRVFVLLEKVGHPAVAVVRSDSKVMDSIEFMKELVNNREKM